MGRQWQVRVLARRAICRLRQLRVAIGLANPAAPAHQRELHWPQVWAALAAAILAGAVAPAGAATSRLWGAAGELWDPAGLLPDFSFAGEPGSLITW